MLSFDPDPGMSARSHRLVRFCTRIVTGGVIGTLLSVASTSTAEAQRPARRAAAASRIAVVDVQMLLDSVPGRGAAEAGLAGEVRLAETRVRLAADSLQRVVERFAREQGDLTPAQREAATLTLRARELQLEDMVQQLNRSVTERRAALQAPLVACVRRAMRDVQQRDGWHVIAERDALGMLAVVHPDVDVTQQVLDVLRARGGEPCPGA